MVFEIECEFKLDGFMFSLGSCKAQEEHSRMIIPGMNRKIILQ